MDDLPGKKPSGSASVGGGATPGSVMRVLAPGGAATGAGAGSGAGLSVFGSPDIGTGKGGMRAVSTFDLVDRGA